MPKPALQQLVRHGRTYPAALEDAVPRSLDEAVVVGVGSLAPDPELRRLGEPHLRQMLARSPDSFDGVVLALERIEDGVVHTRRGSYFDMVATCDALAAEARAASPGDAQVAEARAASVGDAQAAEERGASADDGQPLRARASALAGGDPLHSGAGRTAAAGATLVVIRDGTFTLGLRAADLALDPGRWHVVPSGTLDERGLRGTLIDELRDEHALGQDALDGARVIALGYDLDRLRPELVVITRDLGAIPEPQPSAEFVRFREVALDAEAIDALWNELGPSDLTPAAALTLAALERLMTWRH